MKNYYISSLGFEVLGNLYFDENTIIPVSDKLSECKDSEVVNEVNRLFNSSMIQLSEDGESYLPIKEIDQVFLAISRADRTARIIRTDDVKKTVFVYARSGGYAFVELSMLRPDNLKIGSVDFEGVVQMCIPESLNKSEKLILHNNIPTEEQIVRETNRIRQEYGGITTDSELENLAQLHDVKVTIDFLFARKSTVKKRILLVSATVGAGIMYLNKGNVDVCVYNKNDARECLQRILRENL